MNDVNELYQKLKEYKQLPDFIDMINTNFTDHFNYPAKLLNAWTNDYFNSRKYKPDPKGALSARKSISQYYQSQQVHIDPSNIIITASTSESYNLLFSILTSPEDNILLPKPTYPLFEYLAEFSHLQVKYYSLLQNGNWEIDIAELESQIDSRTKFIVLISPNNPTGAMLTSEQTQQLITIARKHSLMIIMDEVFSEFVYGNEMHQHIVTDDVVTFTLNGISKMFALPDLKLAWIATAGPQAKVAEIIDQLETANDVFLNANYLTQAILPDLFIHSRDFQTQMLNTLRENRNALKQALAKYDNLKCVLPSGGIHAVINITNISLDEEKFALELLTKHHVFIHPGYFYDLESEAGVNIVISLLSNKESLIGGIERINRLLD